MAANRLSRALLIGLLMLPVALTAADPEKKAEAKAINTTCPVTGQPVDPTLSPVVVVIGKGDKAKRVVIGIADRSAAAQIKADPQKYAEAAKANRVAK